VVWSAGATDILLKLVSLFVPLRVSKPQELAGFDISRHGEALQSSPCSNWHHLICSRPARLPSQ
jgi:ammonia channel protein AmtB